MMVTRVWEVLCLNIEDGTIHRISAKNTVLATGGLFGRCYFSCTSSAHTVRVPVMGWECDGLTEKDVHTTRTMNICPIPSHARAFMVPVGCLMTEGCLAGRRRNLFSAIVKANALWNGICPHASAKDLTSRDVVSRAMLTMEIREGRGSVGPKKYHVGIQ